jgi:hypothetical protein
MVARWVFWLSLRQSLFPRKWVFWGNFKCTKICYETNSMIKMCCSRAFQWMVMSIGHVSTQSDGPVISNHVLDRSSDISGTRSPHHSALHILAKPLSRKFITLKISVNNIGQIIYNPKFLIKIWVSTDFWLVCWELFLRKDFEAVIVPTCQSFPMKLNPDFRYNLTSNQSKCV